MTTQRLVPVDGKLYAVRWIRRDRRDVKHRYFRRRHDAERFLRKLAAAGRDARLFQTESTWREVAQ